MSVGKATIKIRGIYTDVIIKDQNGKHVETITFANVFCGDFIAGKEVQVELKSF